MRAIHVADDIVPIAEFKTHASALLRRMHETQRPMVITQNGKAAAVVISPEAFDGLGYREFVKSKIKAGIESVATGGSRPLADAAKRVKEKIRRLRGEG